MIKKLPNGKYRVVSKKNKNLGTFDTKEEAVKRLQQVEFFKKKSSIDVEEADDFTYSAISRYLRKKLSSKEFFNFQKKYKENFDSLYLSNEDDFEKKSLEKTLNELSLLEKEASLQDLGTPEEIGKYVANIIKFTTNKISPLNRQKSLNKLRYKIYLLNENELASKEMPASASLGNAITFVKHILFSQDPAYIRKVLNEITKNL